MVLHCTRSNSERMGLMMQTASLNNFAFTYYYYFPCHKEIK